MHFLRIFFTKIAKKGKSYLHVMTWRARQGGELTWRTGPPHGCDAALRPRGRAVGEAPEAHRARPRGRRPRMSTRTSAWGATWQQGGRQVKGPRDNGPW